ncbi:hypothetical protein ACT7DF_11135 [Bacillus cereus]
MEGVAHEAMSMAGHMKRLAS